MLALVSFLATLLLSCGIASSSPQIVAEWVSLDFDWTSMGEDMSAWIADGRYIPDNCALAGIKVFDDEVYLTVPRWTLGVPSTLNKLVYSNGSPLLRPFPSLAANTPDIGGFTYVQSMEIDPLGRMWVLDTGSIDTTGADPIVGVPRVVVLDITSDPPTVLANVTLEAPVALSDTFTFLNDVVVDWRNDWAYISVTNGDGGVIFFDLRTLAARRMTNAFTLGDANAATIDFCAQTTLTLGVSPSDGIALSPDGSLLYWCPLIGTTLYSIETKHLRDTSLTQQQLAAFVVTVGEKTGLSDGLAMTASGQLYYGDFGDCALTTWNTGSQDLTASNQRTVVSDASTMNWVDTFAFDGHGYLWFTTNRLGYFLSGVMDFSGDSGANFRIQKLKINEESYMGAASFHSPSTMILFPLLLLLSCLFMNV